MRVRLTVPKEHVDADTLNPALEASAAVAEKQIEAGLVPPLADAIEQKSVVWAPEPSQQGFEGFDLPTQCLDRGWGDCDDLAPWWAAELRVSNIDPDAKPIVYQSGPKRWHAVVQRGDGSIDDPSRWAGMGKPGSPLPTTRPLTTNGAHAVAVKNLLNGTRARLDVPLLGMGKHVGLALEQVGDGAFDALGRAAGGALGILGFWGAPDLTMLMMHAITHILSGRTEEEFAAIHGCDGYADCGRFVCGLADRVNHMQVGAMHATFDPHTATDIATTIIDPFGLHNLVAPLASDFVKSYATGLSHRGEDDDAPAPKVKKAKKIAEVDATATVGRSFPKGYSSSSSGSSRGGSRGSSSGRGSSSSARGGSSGRGGGGRGGSAQQQQQDPNTGLPIYYNQMDQEGGGGDPFASQYSEYGMQPGYQPQQYSMPGYASYQGSPYAPAQGYPAYAPQYPYMQPPASYPNPYGATIPGTDVAPDAWGGYATPTAFSQYVPQYEAEIRHSAFDDAPLLGQGLAERDVDGDDCPAGYHYELHNGKWHCVQNDPSLSGDDPRQGAGCPPGYHWEPRGGVSVCVPNDS